jgi:hypothetical protein
MSFLPTTTRTLFFSGYLFRLSFQAIFSGYQAINPLLGPISHGYFSGVVDSVENNKEGGRIEIHTNDDHINLEEVNIPGGNKVNESNVVLIEIQECCATTWLGLKLIFLNDTLENFLTWQKNLFTDNMTSASAERYLRFRYNIGSKGIIR